MRDANSGLSSQRRENNQSFKRLAVWHIVILHPEHKRASELHIDLEREFESGIIKVNANLKMELVINENSIAMRKTDQKQTFSILQEETAGM